MYIHLYNCVRTKKYPHIDSFTPRTLCTTMSDVVLCWITLVWFPDLWSTADRNMYGYSVWYYNTSIYGTGLFVLLVCVVKLEQVWFSRGRCPHYYLVSAQYVHLGTCDLSCNTAHARSPPQHMYRSADKSLARPGRKLQRPNSRVTWHVSFQPLEQEKTCNSAHEQTPLPNDTIDSVLRHREVGRAKDLSARLYTHSIAFSAYLLF
jgi:hypothetical protein